MQRLDLKPINNDVKMFKILADLDANGLEKGHDSVMIAQLQKKMQYLRISPMHIKATQKYQEENYAKIKNG